MDDNNTNPDNQALNNPDLISQSTVEPITANSSTQPAKIDTTNSMKATRKKLLLPVIAGAVLLFGGGAAAYNQLVLNSPEKIWEKSLQTTIDGFKQFTELSEQQSDNMGYTVEGSFRVSEPVVVDGTIDGKLYGMDSEFSGNVGLSGVRITGDVRTKGVEGAAYPDVYLKADGFDAVSGLLSFTGQGQQLVDIINEYNDKWFVIDHTLLEEIQNQADGELDVDTSDQMLTQESAKELIDASVPILEEYLLSADETKAVFVIDESFGREEFEGADAYKYSVAVDKDNLQAFVKAYVEAVKDTAYVKSVLEQSGQSIEEALDLDQLYTELESADFSGVKADVWVDMKRKFIRNVRFDVQTNNNEPNYIDLGLPYEGGDELPFTFKIVANEDDNKTELEFVAGYNNKTQDIKLSFDVNTNNNGQKVVATGSLKTTSSNEPIDVEAPSEAINFLELLGVVDVNQLLSPGVPEGFDDPYLYDDSFYDNYYIEQGEPSSEYLDAINEIQL